MSENIRAALRRGLLREDGQEWNPQDLRAALSAEGIELSSGFPVAIDGPDRVIVDAEISSGHGVVNLSTLSSAADVMACADLWPEAAWRLAALLLLGAVEAEELARRAPVVRQPLFLAVGPNTETDRSDVGDLPSVDADAEVDHAEDILEWESEELAACDRDDEWPPMGGAL